MIDAAVWVVVGFTLCLVSLWLWTVLDDFVAEDEAEVSPERIRRTFGDD